MPGKYNQRHALASNGAKMSTIYFLCFQFALQTAKQEKHITSEYIHTGYIRPLSNLLIRDAFVLLLLFIFNGCM
jgi:hypothetical protein